MPDTPLLTAYAQSLTPTPGNVYCMDALDGLRRLPSGSIDMMLTSPPYDNLRTYNGYSFDFEGIARESYRVLKDGGVLVWVVGDATINGSETLTSFRQALYFQSIGFNVHDTMIWQKDGSPFPESTRYWQEFEYMFVMSKGSPKTSNLLEISTRWRNKSHVSDTTRRPDGSLVEKKYAVGNLTRTMPNVWYMPVGYMKTTADKEAYDHPAMFPEELARRHILTWSNPGDVVCDPFSGSGTTWKECLKADRQFIGFEISEEYCELSRRRIANWKRDSDVEVAPGVTQLGLFAQTA